ncbi:MAG TPA: hypothetical protein PK253_13640 [Spirochaetota bacterium]|nr:hypothetical protein [Spirochaetota bacterium]
MKGKYIFVAVIGILLFSSAMVISKDFDFEVVTLEDVSRYSEDRVAYQQIQLTDKQALASPKMDSALASLLIIRDNKMYLIKDGYDNPKELATKRMLLEIQDQLTGNLSFNTINGKPDFIRITDRRNEVMKKVNEDFVMQNFGKFYTNVRDEFLKKHVTLFRNLMIGRADSNIIVKRVPLPRLTKLGGAIEEEKFAITVSARSRDEKVYYAEDADGDGITETLTVNINDGFHWGFKSGPNIVFIYQNKDPEIQKIIGNLTKEAYYGTEEEQNVLKKSMSKEFSPKKNVASTNWDDKEIINRWVSDLVPQTD